jgi:hypothetical protein
VVGVTAVIQGLALGLANLSRGQDRGLLTGVDLVGRCNVQVNDRADQRG